MKLIATVTLMFIVISSSRSDKKAESLNAWNACLKENNLVDEDAKQPYFRNTKSEDVKENIKCQWKCWMEKLGIISAGAYDDDLTLKIFQARPDWAGLFVESERGIRGCKQEKGTGLCDTAYKIALCLKKDKSIHV